jgi:pantothenate synthetase
MSGYTEANCDGDEYSVLSELLNVIVPSRVFYYGSKSEEQFYVIKILYCSS